MQAADVFAIMPVPGAQAQGQGGGLFAAPALDGLFGAAQGELAAGVSQEGSVFAEQLMAALAGLQPQQPIETAPKSEGGEVPETSLKPATATATPTLFAAPEAPEATAFEVADVANEAVSLGSPAAPAESAGPAAAVAVEAFASPAAGSAKPLAPAPDLAKAAAPSTAAPQLSAEAPAAPAPEALTSNAPAPATPAPATPAPASPAPPIAQAAAPTASMAPLPNGLVITPVTGRPAQAAPVSDPAQAAAPPPATAMSQAAVAAKPAAEPGRPQVKSEARPVAPTGVAQKTDAAAGLAPSAADAEVITEAAVTAPDAAEVLEAPADDAAPAPALPYVHSEARPASHAPVFEAPRATEQTVALLSAQITKSLENGKATRFEVQLDPVGLGKVDVKIEIRPSGDIRADLSFENPIAAGELKARSAELGAALERAGFDPSKTQLSFNSGNQQGFAGQFAQDQWRQQQGGSNASWRGAAFMDLAEVPQNPVAAYFARERAGGVDVRI